MQNVRTYNMTMYTLSDYWEMVKSLSIHDPDFGLSVGMFVIGIFVAAAVWPQVRQE
jgi:hypothetical protein